MSRKPCEATIRADSVSEGRLGARVSDDHAVYSGDLRRHPAVGLLGVRRLDRVGQHVRQKGQYSTPPGNDQGLDVNDKGRSATVDARLANVEGGDSVTSRPPSPAQGRQGLDEGHRQHGRTDDDRDRQQVAQPEVRRRLVGASRARPGPTGPAPSP